MGRFVIGIDIGGTNIKMGLVASSGRLLSRTALATRTFVRRPGNLISAILEGCHSLMRENRLKSKDLNGIGIGLPGLINHELGIVRTLTNIPGWKNIPLKKICEEKIRIPVFIDNDVNIMTLGEWKFGAGVGFNNLVCMTLGTGVGGGFILDGRLYRGVGGCAGELGHIPLNENGPDCKCGGWGCLERTVGNRYLIEKARRVFNGKDIALEDIDQKAACGDKRALRFWQETGEHIGNGLIAVINLLNPERIIIGGGISNAHIHLFKTIDQVIKRRAIKIPAQMVKIVKAKLGDHAAIIGAQVLVNDATKKRS